MGARTMLHGEFHTWERVRSDGADDYGVRVEQGLPAEAVQTHGQSGLPVRFRRGMPLIPGTSAARRRHLVAKRVLDIGLSLASMVVLLPVMVLIALAVRATSPGPALFCQEREGLGGRTIRIYKFRTLEVMACDASGLRPVRDGDPGLTPIGNLLRRSCLDELPQIFNILRGDMSIVGPRPHVRLMRAGPVRYSRAVPYYAIRHLMAPGLSGWAQANGLRGSVTTPQDAKARVDHDIAYLQNFSVWLDLKIIVLTGLRLLSGTLNR